MFEHQLIVTEYARANGDGNNVEIGVLAVGLRERDGDHPLITKRCTDLDQQNAEISV
jgi:hypothetical protein